MWLKYKNQHGVTLLEIMLVTAISASIILMGLNQYQAYKISSDAAEINASADKIFQAASLYYRMQCRANRQATADANTLSPDITANQVAINIQTDLVDTGLLRDNFPMNPLIDDQAAGTWNGFMVQFLRQEEPRLICLASTTPGANAYSADCTSTTQVGVIVNWQIQVSAKVRHSNQAEMLKNLTTADCLTSADGTGVADCQNAIIFAQNCAADEAIMNANSPGSAAYDAAAQSYHDDGCDSGYNNYLSFQRPPSFSTDPKSQSGLWMTNKRVKEFTQMYEITNLYHIMNSSTVPTQYFTCNN